MRQRLVLLLLVAASCTTAKPSPDTANLPAGTMVGQTRLLGSVGGVTVAAYPPSGFDALSKQERVLAYHLAQAALAGDAIYYMQTSRYAWPIKQAIDAIHAKREALPKEVVAKIVDYRRNLFINHGIHDSREGKKYLPPFSREELLEAAKTAGVTVNDDLLAGMFDPNVAPTVVNKTPKDGKDPLVESAANHYEGLTTHELEGFKEQYELNGRLVKVNGKITEQVYRAGGDGAEKGLAADLMQKMVDHLEAAIALSPPAEQDSLRHLVKYFRTGENGEFTQHDIAWLKQVFPVDYILGFVETYSDVRGFKGSFEGFVAIRDPVRDPPLQQLSKNALYFEGKMPWLEVWKRTSFNPPAAAAVNVIAASGDAGPMTFLGVNLPNAQDLREKYGSKNFVVLSVGDTRDELVGKKTIEEFAPEESRAEMLRCASYLDYAATSFHEVTGHGSGKVNPDLKQDPEKLLAPYYSTLEEGRAELVADFLSGDPKTVEIGLLPDVGCQKIFPQFKTTMGLVYLKYVPEGDTAEEDHLRANMIAFGYLQEKGAIAVETRNGKTVPVVKDPVQWRRSIGELLSEYQRIKATGDRQALKTLVDTYGTKVNTKWRDEVIARLKALSLPRVIAMIPPTLTPVMEGGKITDVKAAQTESLDAYIDVVAAAGK